MTSLDTQNDRPEMAAAQGMEAVRSVDRTLAILMAVAEQQNALSISELAAIVGLHTTTVHRLVSTLVQSGWIEQSSSSSRYRISPRMHAIAALGAYGSPLMANAQETTRRLADRLGWSCYFSMLIGRRVVHMARSQGRLSVAGLTRDFRVGASPPIHASADGKVLLANLPTSRRLEILRADPPRRYTEHTIVDEDALLMECDTILSQGHALERGERLTFLKGIAVPVLGLADGTNASLLCWGRYELTLETETLFSEELKLAAHELAERVALDH